MTSPTLSFQTTAVPSDPDPTVDALIAGVKWGGGVGNGVQLTYSFPWSVPGASATFAGYNGGAYSPLNEPAAAQVYGLNAAEQAAAASALGGWASVANVSYRPVADTATDVGDIRFAFTSVSQTSATGSPAWGWATLPDSYIPAAGDVWISTAVTGNTAADWAPSTKNYESLLHEIGHTLGLKHTFEAMGTQTQTLPTALDTEQYSVMSYTPGSHSLYFKISTDQYGHEYGQFVTIHPDTPMLLDIAAAQYLYGPNMASHTGNDVYQFDPATPFMRTIWDAGGTDTISVSNFTLGCLIDLQAGHFSNIAIPSPSTAGFAFTSTPPTPTYDGTANLAIAYGVTIENAIGGSGYDTLIGNGAANDLHGGPGDDILNGGAGIDTASYSGVASNFSWLPSATGFTVKDKANVEGTDTLTSMERLHFADEFVALDLGGDAGMVAKILGAVFGAGALHNAAYVGIGLKYADAGMSYPDLMQFALGAAPGLTSNKAVVDALYTNIVGTAPDAGTEGFYVDLLQKGTYTPATLGVMAADTQMNQDHIGLVGLAATGLVYLPA